MAHPLSIRIRALESYGSGEGTQEEIANNLNVSLSTFKRWLTRRRNNESLALNNNNKGRPSSIDEHGLSIIKAMVEKNPSITLSELSAAYYKERKKLVGLSVLSRAVRSLNFRYKKLSIKAAEKNSMDVKKKNNLST